jgi:hypothetical protein
MAASAASVSLDLNQILALARRVELGQLAPEDGPRSPRCSSRSA